MPNRCVAGGYSNFADVEKGIVLHGIPFLNDGRPEAKRRRRKWIKFVKQKRARWEPTKTSALCSLHFKPDDFQRRFTIPDALANRPVIPRLRDDIGVSVFPSVHAKSLTLTSELTEAQSNRGRRMSLKNAKRRIESLQEEQDGVDNMVEHVNDETINIRAEAEDGSGSDEEYSISTRDSFTQTEEPNDECRSCAKLQSRTRQLRNQLITVRSKLNRCRAQIKETKTAMNISQETKTTSPIPKENNINYVSPDDYIYDDSSDDTIEEEPEISEVDNMEIESETDTETEDEDEDDQEEGSRVYIKDDNLRTHPKFIVFLSQLLLLFRFCHTCKSDGPFVEAKQVGTMVVVTSTCANKKCSSKDVIWKSQPYMTGT